MAGLDEARGERLVSFLLPPGGLSSPERTLLLIILTRVVERLLLTVILLSREFIIRVLKNLYLKSNRSCLTSLSIANP